MSNDNYPAGVTDAHEHFNPSETYVEVECETEEALTVPSFAVKAQLIKLQEMASAVPGASKLYDELGLTLTLISELEQEREYECQWKGEQELPVSEAAEWDCPRCGQTQTTDTLPGDPEDDAYDRMRDSRYDD